MGSNTEPYEETVQFEEPLGHMGKSGSLTQSAFGRGDIASPLAKDSGGFIKLPVH